MWSAIERLEVASQATREEQVAMNARLDVFALRIDKLFYAIMGGSIGVVGALVAHAFKIS